jgi:cytochrome c oxidase subunit II
MTCPLLRRTSLNIVASHEDNPYLGVIVPINSQSVSFGKRAGCSVEKGKLHERIAFTFRVVATLLLLAFACAPTAKPASSRHVEVVAKRFVFEPAEITLKKDEAVDLVLTSEDVSHGVRIRELHLDLHAEKGKSAEVTLTPSVTGTFVGHCSIFCGSGHGQMTLTIHVVG